MLLLTLLRKRAVIYEFITPIKCVFLVVAAHRVDYWRFSLFGATLTDFHSFTLKIQEMVVLTTYCQLRLGLHYERKGCRRFSIVVENQIRVQV